jgi:nucleoid-associated protein YgaU
MSIISFMRDAGEQLFKRPHPAPQVHTIPGRVEAARGNPSTSATSTTTTTTTSAAKPDVDALEASAARAIRNYVASKGLPVDKLDVDYDANSATVTVSGSVPDQDTREKVVVCCGNVASVEHVNDQMQVANAGKPGEYYTVQAGDNLSKIARHFYGDANRYSAIFEANKPMLADPDKIYPGQTLRIPRLS